MESQTNQNDSEITITESCWICFQEEGDTQQVCLCPKKIHLHCLAKWQMHNIGGSEEQKCRFCHKQFPDWREAYNISPDSSIKSPVTFNLQFGGRSHKIKVTPDGFTNFQDLIRTTFGISEDQEFDIVYHCKIPGEKTKISFQDGSDKEKKYRTAIQLAAASMNNTEKPVEEPSHGILNTLTRLFSR